MSAPGVRLFFPTRPGRATNQSQQKEVGMDSGMIGKIQKAKIYAQERDRLNFESFKVTFDGTNNKHAISYNSGKWQCTCDFFQSRGRCSHTMALEEILDPMLSCNFQAARMINYSGSFCFENQSFGILK